MGVMDWNYWRMLVGCILVSLNLSSAEATNLQRSDMNDIYRYEDIFLRNVRIENLMLKNLLTGMRGIKKGQSYLRKKSTNLLNEILAEKLNWRKSGSVTTSL